MTGMRAQFCHRHLPAESIHPLTRAERVRFLEPLPEVNGLERKGLPDFPEIWRR